MAHLKNFSVFVVFVAVSIAGGLAEPSRVIILEASSDAIEEPSHENVSSHHTASERLPSATMLMQHTELAETQKVNGSSLVGKTLEEETVRLFRESRVSGNPPRTKTRVYSLRTVSVD